MSKIHLPRRRFHRGRLVLSLAVVVIAAFAIAAVALSGILGYRATSAATVVPIDVTTEQHLPVVKAIRPKVDPSLQATVRQQAIVEPFFQADLRARASGLVRAVYKDIGDRVQKGELLVEIDVPDQEYEVAQKEGVIEQRRQELRVADAKLQFANAEVEVGLKAIKQRKAEVGQAVAVQASRRMLLVRVRQMAKRDVVQPERVEEVERDSLAADSAVRAAEAAVEKAEADLKEKNASVAAAQADVALKTTMIEVARRDFERSRALSEYARIRAPFDGKVVDRKVDPGSFVQNATTGRSDVLISVARSDLLTVSAFFPDNAAPFIEEGTPALIELDDFPDAAISAHVSRCPCAIRNSDRTMQVEVDLYNGTRREFDRLAQRTVTAALTPLSASCPLGIGGITYLSQDVLWGQRKSTADQLPPPVLTETPGRTPRRILPGMTAVMRLHLTHFNNPYVIPSSAIYTRGGKPYLLLVRGDRTKQVPVHVHVNDGTLAKVSLVERVGDGRGGHREVLRELTGSEEIVASRQIEIGDGEVVSPALSEW